MVIRDQVRDEMRLAEERLEGLEGSHLLADHGRRDQGLRLAIV